MNFLEELQWRGLVKDVTDLEGLAEKLKTKTTAYCGFDPTASSLHVGHFQQILLVRRYQDAGHRVIVLCGGATGMIGDPRPTTERKMITLEEVANNVQSIRSQLAKFINFDDAEKGLLLNNHDWLKSIGLLDFLRDYGKYFSVSTMINKDIIQRRLETGISFTEFTYTILQAADWLHLYKTYQCEIQFGGSDQWGNLLSGNDLIHKICGEDSKVFGITSPLITKSDGSKFGKSEGGNIWLDPTLTGAYEFYQFWVNVSDADIKSLLRRLSLRKPEEIMILEEKVDSAPEKREAQIALAEELTELVHGLEGLKKAQKITETLFKGSVKTLSPDELREGLKDALKCEVEDGVSLIDALVVAGISKSKGDARKLIQQGAIQVNGEKIDSLDAKLFKSDAFDQSFSIIKKGKKSYFVIMFL